MKLRMTSLSTLTSLLSLSAVSCSIDSPPDRESTVQSKQAIHHGSKFTSPISDPNLVTIYEQGLGSCSGVYVKNATNGAIFTNAHCVRSWTEYEVAFGQKGGFDFQKVTTPLIPKDPKNLDPDAPKMSKRRIFGGYIPRLDDKGQLVLNYHDFAVLFVNAVPDPAAGLTAASVDCTGSGATLPPYVDVHSGTALVENSVAGANTGYKNYATFAVVPSDTEAWAQGTFAMRGNAATTLLPEQHIIRGDSGAPVYNPDTKKLVGLIYGGYVGTREGYALHVAPICQWLFGDALDPNVLTGMYADLNLDGTEETQLRIARSGSDLVLALNSPLLGNYSLSVSGLDPALDPTIAAVGDFVNTTAQVATMRALDPHITLYKLDSSGASSTVDLPTDKNYLSLIARNLDNQDGDGTVRRDLIATTDDGQNVVIWGSSTGPYVDTNAKIAWLNWDGDAIPDTIVATASSIYNGSSKKGLPPRITMPSGFGAPMQVLPGHFSDRGATGKFREDFTIIGATGVLYCRGTDSGDVVSSGCVALESGTGSVGKTGGAVSDIDEDGYADLRITYAAGTPDRIYYGSATGLTSSQKATMTGMPTTDANDGRFVTISGQGFNTADEPKLTLKLVVPSAASKFSVEIFDGDLGGYHDAPPQAALTSPHACYVVWSDPCGNLTTDCVQGSTTASVEIVAKGIDTDFEDNSWSKLTSLSTSAKAKSPGGDFVYRLDSFLVNGEPPAGSPQTDLCNVTIAGLNTVPDRTISLINAFKVRATGATSLRGGTLSFIGLDVEGPWATPNGKDAGWYQTDTKYDGTFDFYFSVGTAATATVMTKADTRKLLLTEADADHLLAIPKGVALGANDKVSYTVSSPVGPELSLPYVSATETIYPTGNYVAQGQGRMTYEVPVASAKLGDWVWHWQGVGAINNIFISAVAGSPTTFELTTSKIAHAPESSAKAASSWATSTTSDLLPIVLGSADASGAPLGLSKRIATVADAVTILSTSANSLEKQLLAAKLNLKAAAKSGEQLNTALIYGAPVTVARLVARADVIEGSGAVVAAAGEVTEVTSLLEVLNSGQTTYYRQEVPREDQLNTDVDGDGIVGALDNCPTIKNMDQLDSNADRIGDACSVVPIAKCVIRRDTSNWTAQFGYNNPLSYRYIPTSVSNRFLNGAVDRGQPMEFAAGTPATTVGVNFTTGQSVSWQLEGKTVTLNGSSPDCGGVDLLQNHPLGLTPLYATNTLNFLASAVVEVPQGVSAALTSGTLNLASSASMGGNVWVKGTSFLGSSSNITGYLVSGGAVTKQAGYTVSGGISEKGNVPSYSIVYQSTFPTGTALAVSVSPGQTQTLVSGKLYGQVSVKGTLKLTAGTYFIDTLTFDTGSSLVIDDSLGAVNVNVRTSLTYRGTTSVLSGHVANLVVGYFGVNAAFVETAISGAILAPNGKLVLGTDNGGLYRGQFFAKDLEVRSKTKVQYAVRGQ